MPPFVSIASPDGLSKCSPGEQATTCCAAAAAAAAVATEACPVREVDARVVCDREPRNEDLSSLAMSSTGRVNAACLGFFLIVVVPGVGEGVEGEVGKAGVEAAKEAGRAARAGRVGGAEGGG